MKRIIIIGAVIGSSMIVSCASHKLQKKESAKTETNSNLDISSGAYKLSDIAITANKTNLLTMEQKTTKFSNPDSLGRQHKTEETETKLTDKSEIAEKTDKKESEARYFVNKSYYINKSYLVSNTTEKTYTWWDIHWLEVSLGVVILVFILIRIFRSKIQKYISWV